MAHPEQYAFVESVKVRYPENFNRASVLEIGSRDVNGSVRELFTGCRYLGIDYQPGPGVDRVTLAHEIGFSHGFDTVITCETLEHDPHVEKTLESCHRALKPGGLFIATFAGPARPVHGTTETGEIYGPDPTYYRNLSPDDFATSVDGYFSYLEIHLCREEQDVYVVAWA